MQQSRNQVEPVLQGARICTFCQDTDLRYVSASSPMFGHSVDEIVGRTDADIVPPDIRGSLTAVKRDAIENNRIVDCEFSMGEDDARRWFDLHIEPLHNSDGAVVGLTGTSVDVTEHRLNETHLRMLMRELTHRSKNLLAVIQAMARQIARHSGSIETFLDQFNARLQALAMSHDLLVQGSWHGASLAEMVRLQLAPYVDRDNKQLTVEGPGIIVKPDAAQSIGLALHELATNAAKHGALSKPSGRISVTWRRQSPAEGYGVELTWVEEGGPTVSRPTNRGFGSTVIERNLARSLDAEVEWTFATEGLRCKINIPVTQLVAGFAGIARP